MKRKPGTLRPIELRVLDVALAHRARGHSEFYGYRIARELDAGREGRSLTGDGTLYRALERLERDGLLAARWESQADDLERGRPRRRLYQVTAAGEAAWRRAHRIEATSTGGFAWGGPLGQP